MGRDRTLKEWLFGESFSDWYIPTEDEIYAVFFNETEAEFKYAVSSGEDADVLWGQFLEWCIGEFESVCRRLKESRTYSRQRDYYSQNLLKRIWLRLSDPRFDGMPV